MKKVVSIFALAIALMVLVLTVSTTQTKACLEKEKSMKIVAFFAGVKVPHV